MARRLCSIGLFYVVLAGCAAPHAAAPKPSLADAWREDIDYLARELPRRHKNAFFKCTRADFETAAAKLRDEIPRLANHEIVVGILRLIAMVGDGHTQAQNYSQVGDFRSLPITVEWLKDGYYVTRTTRSHSAILGMRLTRVGKTPIDDAAKRLAELFAAENEMQSRRRVPVALRCPEMLHACGIINQIDTAEFTFVDDKGTESRATLSPTPTGVELRWVHAAETIPLAEQRPGEPYWYKILKVDDRGKAMYLAYNTCNGFGAFRKLAAEMFRQIPTSQPIKPVPWRLIIDLRRNGGGNSMVIDVIYGHIAWRPELLKPGRILVLIGRGTFSSAMMNAVQLRNRYHAVLIGEPTGGSPNGYGEIKPLTLPHSRLTLMYSTKYFELQPGGAQTVTPDVLIDTTIDDVLTGRDPVLEAALSYTPPAASTAGNSK
ncbi:MAG: hypothetical protein HZA51_11355 [Planctomycetes bacterium]|nr:hypothetical protein [Planctomycetota bacterium]